MKLQELIFYGLKILFFSKFRVKLNLQKMQFLGLENTIFQKFGPSLDEFLVPPMLRPSHKIHLLRSISIEISQIWTTGLDWQYTRYF